MSNELINILSNSNKDIDNQKLMDYLSDKLSGKEKHDVEKLMADSALFNDAVEGLQQFKNKTQLSAFVSQLNADLHKQLLKKAQRKQKRKLREHFWIYLAVIVILLLIIIGFIVIKTHLAA
jgi:phage terminase small subunit